MINFKLNNRPVSVDVPGDTPLLWVLREELQQKGTKFGCGKGLCGACTVHFNGQPVRICILPVSAVADQSIDTIDGLATEGGSHPVQRAWVKHNVPQCGYCQSGQIMKAAGLLEQKPKWKRDDLLASMDGNICRCGTYQQIKTALLDAAAEMGKLDD